MTTASSKFHRRARLASPALILVSGVIAALAGCTTSTDQTLMTGGISDDYRHNHPIAVEEMLETMDIPVGQDTASLSTPFQQTIAGFGHAFAASGSSLIAVVAPSGSPNQVAAANVAVQVEQVLRRSGVKPRSIEYRVYRAGPEERNAPIRIAYNRVAAHTAPCGPWPDHVTDSSQNRHYAGFGCATQQNLAAMVASPLDLIYPRGLTPPDAERRATVLDKYRQGQVTSAQQQQQSGGTIATGIGQ